MLSKVQSALKDLLAPGEPLLIGVSGGPDSVALLDALVQSGWLPHVCHLNHKLRGADSDADAEFVRQLAQRYQLAVTVEARDVGGFASERKISIEDAARRARHEFFSSVSARTGTDKLALAHTADDQVETFLLRLFRGAGAPGLIGIWPVRQIGSLRVIRPLLNVRRQEVLEYLTGKQLSCRADASNLDTRFTRNRIRHELLPLLEKEFNPGIRDVLLRTAEILRDEDSYLLGHVVQAFYPAVCKNDAVHLRKFADCPVAVQRRLLRIWLGGRDESEMRFTFDHIEAVRELAVVECPSAEAHLPEDVVVYREYEWLRKARRDELEPVCGRWRLNLPGETVIRELGVRLVTECDPRALETFSGNRQGVLNPPHFKEESFDADTLGGSPFIRTWQEGDRFRPLGMSCDKKLQDFFVDEKVPRLQRRRVPLLCAFDGRIAWVVGHRIAEPFKMTQQTQRVLRVRSAGL
jgi:tRNA(Ile)-lysidine synthase